MPGIERKPRQLKGPRTWDRQPGETDRAWEAFRAFDDLGPGRTIADAYRTLTGKSDAPRAPSWWYDWVVAWSWYERIRAKESHIEQEVEEREIQARLEARRLRRQVSQALMSTGLMGLQRHRERLDARARNDLAPLREYVQAIRDGAEQNRRDWDEEPVQRVQQATALQTVIKLSADDLDNLDARTLTNAFKAFDDDPAGVIQLVTTTTKGD